MSILAPVSLPSLICASIIYSYYLVCEYSRTKRKTPPNLYSLTFIRKMINTLSMPFGLYLTAQGPRSLPNFWEKSVASFLKNIQA